MLRSERGASAVEYGLLVALFAAVMIVAAFSFKTVLVLIVDDTACDPGRGYHCTKN